METGNGKPDKVAPPYFAFKTLLNMLDQMKPAIPTRIDRSFLVGMSGAGQTQFITGLKSLGLIDAAGTVSDRFKEMAQGGPAERKRLLGELLKERYPEAVELGNTNATTAQLLEVFREYGASGDTARKGIAFYLQAAKYADIPLSRYFQTPKISSGAGSSRKRRKIAEPASSPEEAGRGQDEGTGGQAFPEFHQILAGVLSEFPSYPHGWTQTRRDEVMKMLEMAVAFTIPIKSEEEIADDERETEEDEVERLEE